MSNLISELQGLKEAFAAQAIDLATFLRNVERVESEIAYIRGAV